MNLEIIRNTAVHWITTMGVRIIVSVILLLISFRLISQICKRLTATLEKRQNLDKTLTRTFSYVSSVILKGLVIICLIDYLGIETSVISAVVASLSVCAGLAVNGTLSNLLLEICGNEQKILSDPAPFAGITDYGSGNGMTMSLRVWCRTEDYWDVYLDLLEKAQKAFEDKRIVIPFQQLDVHMK